MTEQEKRWTAWKCPDCGEQISEHAEAEINGKWIVGHFHEDGFRAAVSVEVVPASRVTQLEEAARNVLASVVSSGSGPVAPVFDRYDAEVERNRGAWSVIDGAALDKLRAALKAVPDA